MTIYGVALLAFCFLAGKLTGTLLGVLIGIDGDVGGVGFAMLLLIFGNAWLKRRGWLSRTLLRGFIPGVAIAILAGLGLAFLGGKKGIADLPLFSGMALLGGSMLGDFSVVATAMGADHGRHPAHRPLHRPRGYGSEAGALRGADGYVLYRAGVPALPFGAVFGGVGGGGLSGGQARFTSSCKSGKRARNSSVSRS